MKAARFALGGFLLYACMAGSLYAERFINATENKVKVIIYNVNHTTKLKEFSVDPLSTREKDLSKYDSQGICVAIGVCRSIDDAYDDEDDNDDNNFVDADDDVFRKHHKKCDSDSDSDNGCLVVPPKKMNCKNEFVIFSCKPCCFKVVLLSHKKPCCFSRDRSQAVI